MPMKDLYEHRVGNKSNAELRVAFSCPQCKNPGTVEWRKLNRQMRCHKCGCEFQIGKNSVRPVATQTAQRVRFDCPRCKHGGSVLQAVAIRGIKCVACDFPLYLGPDNQLHSAEEVAQLELALVEAAKPGRLEGYFEKISSSRFARLMESWLKWPVAAVMLLVAGLFCMYAGGFFTSLTGGHLPAVRAKNFTYACLERDKSAPLPFVGDDPIQNSIFQRWKPYYFASIGDQVRPSGDTVSISVEVNSEEPDKQILTVKLKSNHIGERVHEQHWRRQNDEWLFDSVSTMDSLLQPSSAMKQENQSRK